MQNFILFIFKSTLKQHSVKPQNQANQTKIETQEQSLIPGKDIQLVDIIPLQNENKKLTDGVRQNKIKIKETQCLLTPFIYWISFL